MTRRVTASVEVWSSCSPCSGPRRRRPRIKRRRRPRLRRDPASRARHRPAAALVLLGAAHPRQGLRAAAPGPAGRRPPPDPGPRHQSAPGRRQGRAVPDPRLRRRPRHRPGALRRRPPGQHAQPRARAGLRRPALPDPGDGQDGRRAQGSLLRRVRRLRHRRGRELRHPGLRRGEHAGGGRRQLQHPALPGPALAEPRGAQDLRRDRAYHSDGPFDKPNGYDALQSLREGERRHRGGHAAGGVGVLTTAPSGTAPGEIPARAVRSGLIDRFGAIDPTEGGVTQRTNVNVEYTLEADREPEAVRPRLPDLLRAQPVQRLHVLPERPARWATRSTSGIGASWPASTPSTRSSRGPPGSRSRPPPGSSTASTPRTSSSPTRRSGTRPGASRT